MTHPSETVSTRDPSASPTRLAAFTLPAAPLLALSLPPLIFLPPYYARYLDIDVGLVGAAFLLARIFDIVLNPTIGGLQDRTVTAFGRRRLWLAGATPVLMFFVWLAFIAMPVNAPALLLTIVIMGLYSSFAAMMIGHLSWAGELRPDYHGRTQVLGAVQATSTLGQVGILVLPALVQMSGLGDFQDGVHIMGWTIIVVLPLTVGLALAAMPEKQRPPSARIGFKEAMQALAKNQSLRAILAPDFLIGMTQGVTGTLFVFFFQYVMGFERQAEALLLVYFIGALAGVPLWIYLGAKLGKHRALQLGCGWWALNLMVIPFLPPGNLPLAFIGLALAGIANGATVLLLRSMMADVVDEDELHTGAQRAGLYFGLLLTTTKVGLAMGPMTFVVLGLFGFDAKLGAANTPEAMNALVLMFGALPLALNLLTIWALQYYPLTEARQREIRDALAARKAAAPTEKAAPSAAPAE